MKKSRYFIIIAIFLVDQLTKLAVRSNMYVGESISVIDKVFHITYVQNRGAAFNMFTGRGVMLVFIPIIALAVAIWYMEKHKDAHWSLFTAMELIIAGGIGNLTDRVVLHFVTDMFDFNIWPVFNVADIAVCVGCGFLILYIFFFDKSDTTCKKDDEALPM